MYVCVCNAVTESQIRQVVVEGVTSLAALKLRLGVGSICGSCEQQAEQTIQECLLKIAAASKTLTKPKVSRPHAT